VGEAGGGWGAVGVEDVAFEGLEGDAAATGEEATQGGETPAADLETFQTETVGTEHGVEVELFEAERIADLAFQAADRAGLEERTLEGFELAADAVDQNARAAEIDGVLTATVAIGEAVVRAEGFAVAAAITGGDVALSDEYVGTEGQQAERGVIELVSRSRDFHFHESVGRMRCKKEKGERGKRGSEGQGCEELVWGNTDLH
jgi:hypothetical protein